MKGIRNVKQSMALVGHIYWRFDKVLSLACLWVGVLRLCEYAFCHFSKSRLK